jgi:hypothetical protein
VSPKYGAHLPKVGNILGGIFPHTDMLESSVFLFFERPLLGEHPRNENFEIFLALLLL